jgi:carbonic anhydrase
MLNHLLQNNRKWAAGKIKDDSQFFVRLSEVQNPEYLWIGCSDSRVPANVIIGLQPGEVFVHRNVANVVVHTDMNCLSVIQFAVEVLHVKHIIVCGHYGCGGVQVALSNKQYGLIDNWLRNIKEIYKVNKNEIDSIKEQNEKVNKLCELNVAAQMLNVCHTTIVQNAWHNGAKLSVHGWIYDIKDGLIHDLGISVSGSERLNDVFKMKLK